MVTPKGNIEVPEISVPVFFAFLKLFSNSYIN